jgi:hypothetical protein
MIVLRVLVARVMQARVQQRLQPGADCCAQAATCLRRQLWSVERLRGASVGLLHHQ